MPLPLALLVALPIGVTFAWAARTELARHDGSVVDTRAFRVAALFCGLVYLPVTAYFVAFHGDWAYLYALPWARVPSAVDLVLVVVVATLTLGAFVVAAPLAAARRGWIVGALFAIPLAAAAALALAADARLATSATYAQFHGGFGAQPIAKSALGRAVLLSLGVLAASIAWSVQLLRQGHGRAPPRRKGE